MFIPILNQWRLKCRVSIICTRVILSYPPWPLPPPLLPPLLILPLFPPLLILPLPLPFPPSPLPSIYVGSSESTALLVVMGLYVGCSIIDSPYVMCVHMYVCIYRMYVCMYVYLFYTRYPQCSIFLYLARVITHVIKQLLSNALPCMHKSISNMIQGQNL